MNGATHHVISTAGHVDHGKSTLIQALTGTDPDRWAEEKARGLTIDLGFAAATLPSGASVSFVDVPGHERFIRNMLAGVGTVDAAIFVVAATEGWKPQSEEHLRILELLGISHGVVALTKIDLVDADLEELAELDVVEHTEGTFLEGAPIVKVGATSGIGVDALRSALDELVERTPMAADNERPRLWIDRVFAAKGSGTVVTGTLTGGSLHHDDELTAVPGGQRVRVRALQSHHEDLTVAAPGRRLAVNLTGVDHRELRRGDALVRNDQWHHTTRFDAEVTILDRLDHEVSRRGAHVAYIGSGEHRVRLRILGPDALLPGDTGLVRLHLDTAVPLMLGDRFVLRESGRGETIGGGRVLDSDPVLRASRARPDGSTDSFIRERGWVDATHFARVTGVAREPDLGRWIVDPELRVEAGAELRAAIGEAGPLGLDLASLDERQRAMLETFDDVELDGTHVRMADAVDHLADHPFIATLQAGGLRPDPPEGIERGDLRELVRRGIVVESEGLFFAATAVDEAARIVAGLLAASPEGVTVAAIREAWDTSRKFAIPLLARLDSTGVTRRREDLRIGGRRLPPVPGDQGSGRIPENPTT